MKKTARDIMNTDFRRLKPDMPISQAVKLFKQASKEENRRVFGMMVLDSEDTLVGMLSMYDILLFMKPKHIHIWGMMDDIDIEGLIDTACRKAKSIQVGDIMSPDVITIRPDTHKLHILDIMIKKHVRRLPVVDNGKLLGIVYISELFYDLLSRFTDDMETLP